LFIWSVRRRLQAEEKFYYQARLGDKSCWIPLRRRGKTTYPGFINMSTVRRNARGRVGNVPSKSVSKAVVKQMIDSKLRSVEEVKINHSGTSGNTSVAGAVAGITNNIVNNLGISDRVGLKIAVTQLNIRFQCTINALSTSDRVRLIVFADTQNENALPTVSDVLESASVTAHYNLANLTAKRFKILLDTVLQLNTSGSAGTYKHYQIPMGKWPVFYAGGTGYGRNNIFFLEISDTPTNLASFAIANEVLYLDD